MQISELISQLAEIQFKFDKKTTEKKLSLISELKNADFKKSEEIIRYHDRLLCILAFADSQQLFDSASNALKSIIEKIPSFLKNARDNDTWKITLSAMAGSTIRASFSFETVKWLVEDYNTDVSFYSCDASKEIVGYVFKQILPPAVGEALFDNHEPTIEQLVKKVSGKNKSPDILRWTLIQFKSSSINDKSKEQLFEQLKIFIEWKTNPFSPTRTFARAAGGKNYFFSEKTLIHHVDVKKIFSDKKLNAVPLNSIQKKNLCDIAKGVLCSNYREIDPITYSKPDDTELYDTGCGITIALYFMRPSWRLSCETYVSYMAFRNGVPVSYGGAWLFFDRTKVAANIFPPFRGGESAYLFAQLYRLYHLRFGVNCFQVDPYQIGQKNHDAISSGAFWFYYRLGFRPNDKQMQLVVTEEFVKRMNDKKYRTPVSLLRKFAIGEMLLNLSPQMHLAHQDILQRMQTLVTKEYSGNFASYFESCFSELQKACKHKNLAAPKSLLNNPLASELCGLVSIFSNYSLLDKNELKKFISAMEEKAFGSDRRFLEIFYGIKKFKEDIYKYSESRF